MGEYDHILSKYDLFFFSVEKCEKSGISKQLFGIEISKMPNSLTKNTGRPLCILS